MHILASDEISLSAHISSLVLVLVLVGTVSEQVRIEVTYLCFSCLQVVSSEDVVVVVSCSNQEL